MKKRIYFENLDGLRFICFLMVFGAHAFNTHIESVKDSGIHQLIKGRIFQNGNLGVNFFFVLSGFLISYLLIAEKKFNGKIHILKFWTRRILRIWPLYFFCVFFGFFIFPIAKSYFGEVSSETANLGYYLTFLSNFDSLRHGPPDSSVLSVLWSVAIEEQFYFFWPIILSTVPVKRYGIVFITIISASLIFRYFHNDLLMNEQSTFSCIGDMAIGGLGAWLSTQSLFFKNKITDLKRYQIFIIYCVAVLILLFRKEIFFNNYYLQGMERIFIAVIFLMIILEQTFANNSLFKLSNYRFSNLGIITYGLYCLHTIALLIVTTITSQLMWNTQTWQVMILEPAFALILSIVISKFSYRYFEKPFLKLKDRFAYIVRGDQDEIYSKEKVAKVAFS